MLLLSLPWGLGSVSVCVPSRPEPEGGLLLRSSIRLPDGSALPNAVQKSLSQLWISKLLLASKDFLNIMSPSAKLIFPLSLFPPPIIWVWICSSFKFGSVRAREFCNKMPLQRSPDTAAGKAQRVKISLKMYTTGFDFIHCVFWYTKGYYSKLFWAKRHCCKLSNSMEFTSCDWAGTYTPQN